MHIDANIDVDFYEELFVHEGSHVSLDYSFGGVVDRVTWETAMQSDCGEAISIYARNYPDREDVAESLNAYLALRWYANRLTAEDRDGIQHVMPNRIKAFDKLQSPKCDLSPPMPAPTLFGTPTPLSAALTLEQRLLKA